MKKPSKKNLHQLAQTHQLTPQMHTIGKPKNEAMESSVGQMLAYLLSFSLKESSERNELAELISLQSNKDLQK